MTKGILIIGYGTRKGNLTEILETQARRLRCRGWEHVGIGYFRVSKPTIPEALAQLVDEGADEIVAIPYFIAEGKLTKQFIPEQLGMKDPQMSEVVVNGRKVTICLAPAFGNTFALTDIVCDRIAGAGGDMDAGILILGHGTLHESLANLRVVKQNAERISGMGYEHVVYAFNEFCEPTIKDALDILEKQGVERIIAVPLFIAMGVHLGEEIPEQLGIPPYCDHGNVNVNGRKIPLAYTRPVEANPRLTDYLDEMACRYL